MHTFKKWLKHLALFTHYVTVVMANYLQQFLQNFTQTVKYKYIHYEEKMQSASRLVAKIVLFPLNWKNSTSKSKGKKTVFK